MPTNFSTSIFGTTISIDDLFVTADAFRQGNLWVWGYNAYGNLGDNTTAQKNTPITTLTGGANWKQVSGGSLGYSTAAIKTDGTLWTWGRNSNGQLGDNTLVQKITPVTTFAGATNWKQVSSGDSHITAIKTDGTLWTWGYNLFGQLGINSQNNSTTPVTTFAGGTNWKQVASGQLFSMAIKTDGTLWGWGSNNPQLGDNTSVNKLTPVTTFAGGTNWKQIAVGDFHVAAIKTDGTLWTWGYNGYGQLGDNTNIDRSTPITTFVGGTNWKQVAAGSKSIAAIKTDGTLWTWGNNAYGQLGDNTQISRSTPVTTFSGGTNWKQVSCNENHMAAIKTDGTLWTWGRNVNGQLGNNLVGNNNILTPITTFLGGTNWKQVSCGKRYIAAITYIDDYQ